MRYTEEETDMIHQGKIILNKLRSIYRERQQLLEEYNEEPAPRSPSLQENKGASLSQLARMNDYTFKRELILKKIDFLTDIINQFTLKTLLLPTRQRQILDVYMNTSSYQDMLDTLNEKYYISTSTYKRELPKICLSLVKYINYQEVLSLEEVNEQFLKTIES